ncbi:DNA-processing protein DprA [Pseudonocardia nigra]|uniref:DNA-processing protein DprA n=1 Tax=Pseudonocardia nigra TaxID=1921578 RepID=UPI0027E32F8E|nr:DNA-processing protein DprA [Pseudonocardia nigra]
MSEEVLLARAYLSRVVEPPAPGLAQLVAAVGPVEAAQRVRAGRVDEQVAGETGARRTVDRAAADLAAARTAGSRLLTPEHDEWPAWPFAAFAITGVRELAPPLALWVRGPGRLAALCERAVGVVGARAATSYGMHVAGELSAGMADRGFTVVSGAAIGIDGAAHRGALAVDGATVAVLACGVDRAYPAAHQALLERIAATGLVVSEYPPGCVPGRHRFLVRNRLIAGMSEGTLVVEAGLRSGAQRTAADAAALGRLVLAVPGPVTSGLSAGCHRLIRDGALLVTRTEEVLEAVGRLGLDLADTPTSDVGRPTDALDPVAALVHDALPTRTPRDTRWLAMEAASAPCAWRSSTWNVAASSNTATAAGAASRPGAGRDHRRVRSRRSHDPARGPVPSVGAGISGRRRPQRETERTASRGERYGRRSPAARWRGPAPGARATAARGAGA